MSSTEKPLLAGSYEAVMPYETLTYRTPNIELQILSGGI